MMEKLDNQYGADALSEALDVSESGFAAHRGKQDGQRWKEDAELRALIAQSFEQSRNTYGSPRVRLDLRELGKRCGKNRVARLMRESGLRAPAEAPFSASHQPERVAIITRSNNSRRPSKTLLRITRPRPNRSRWVKSADQILASITRFARSAVLKEINDSGY